MVSCFWALRCKSFNVLRRKKDKENGKGNKEKGKK